MDDDDDILSFMINLIIGGIVLAIEIGVELVVMCFMAISFILEMIFDWGDD